MAENTKKFLNYEGVSYLWDQIVANINSNVATEKARAEIAEQAAAAAAQAAQTSVDNLSEYVGTIPETATATNVIAYVQEKTAGIATDTALEELTGRVAQAETDIDAIEADYLKAADINDMATKTEVAATYETIANADLVRGRVADLEAHKDDYKAYADQAELDAVATAKAYTDEVKAGILGEGITETYDTLVEIQNWINGAGVDATELSSAIAAETSRAQGAEEALDGRLDILEAIDHSLYAVKTEVETALAGKQNTIPANTYDAYGSASTAEQNAKSYTDAAAAGALTDAKTYADEQFANIVAMTTEDIDKIIKGTSSD